MTCLSSISFQPPIWFEPGSQHPDYQHCLFLYSLPTGVFAGAGGDEPDIQPGKNPDEDKPSDTPVEDKPSDTPDEIGPTDSPDEIPPETPPEIGPDHLPKHPLEPGPVRDMARREPLFVVLTDFAEEKLGEIRDERH